jgi:tetratricopeptide (TPR) repeat protein
MRPDGFNPPGAIYKMRIRMAFRFALPLIGATSAAVLALSLPAAAETARVSKDVGPTSTACDGFEKGSTAWSSCVGQAKASMPDNELFYAGYWLAKSGRYEQALGYLTKAQQKDERILTYMGYATRKLGDVDAALPLYTKALSLNPNYSVARAYMGEAFLTKGQPDKAKAELAEIAQRCGTTCAPYVDLKGHIADYEAAQHG